MYCSCNIKENIFSNFDNGRNLNKLFVAIVFGLLINFADKRIKSILDGLTDGLQRASELKKFVFIVFILLSAF